MQGCCLHFTQSAGSELHFPRRSLICICFGCQATVLKTRRFPIYCHAKMLIADDEVGPVLFRMLYLSVMSAADVTRADLAGHPHPGAATAA